MRKYITTSDELKNAMSYLKTTSVVALDTETTGLDFITDKIILFQVGDEVNQYVFAKENNAQTINSTGSFATLTNVAATIRLQRPIQKF